MTLDGVEVSGDFLLVAVLNIPFIGPNLELCPHADPTDGEFAVVMAGEAHRDAIARHLQHREAERDIGLGVSCWRARRVEIERGDLLHIDDMVFDWPSTGASLDPDRARGAARAGVAGSSNRSGVLE